MELHELAQQRGPGELHDTQFMSAAEKQKVLKQWDSFLKSGCSREKFTRSLYQHLTLHCSFIAHYNIDGFYGTYFTNGDATVRFLSQFDDRKGMPRSVELGWTGWCTREDFCDINCEMIRIADKYIPVLVPIAKAQQKTKDIDIARQLLAKHGVEIDEDELIEQITG